MAVSLCVVSNGTRSILVVKLAFHAAGCKEIFLTVFRKKRATHNVFSKTLTRQRFVFHPRKLRQVDFIKFSLVLEHVCR